jgi:hypothetical protein
VCSSRLDPPQPSVANSTNLSNTVPGDGTNGGFIRSNPMTAYYRRQYCSRRTVCVGVCNKRGEKIS